jgi:hypothetical protein
LRELRYARSGPGHLPEQLTGALDVRHHIAFAHVVLAAECGNRLPGTPSLDQGRERWGDSLGDDQPPSSLGSLDPAAYFLQELPGVPQMRTQIRG